MSLYRSGVAMVAYDPAGYQMLSVDLAHPLESLHGFLGISWASLCTPTSSTVKDAAS